MLHLVNLYRNDFDGSLPTSATNYFLDINVDNHIFPLQYSSVGGYSHKRTAVDYIEHNSVAKGPSAGVGTFLSSHNAPYPSSNDDLWLEAKEIRHAVGT